MTVSRNVIPVIVLVALIAGVLAGIRVWALLAGG